MLPESRLMSFIDQENSFVLHFFEGQKLVEDLALITSIRGEGFNFLRDCTLSAAHLISFLKPNENLGLYIDNQDPVFLFKMEMNEHGHVRSLLMPEDFSEFPDKLSGQGRLSKIFPHQNTPYTSIIELKNHNFHEVVDDVFKTSYQLNSKLVVSEKSDQSVLLVKLPKKAIDKVDEVLPDIPIDEFYEKISTTLHDIFEKGFSLEKDIKERIQTTGLSYLKGKEIKFSCSCSRERMLAGIASLATTMSLDELFDGKDSLETRCDYCKTFYQILRSEIE